MAADPAGSLCGERLASAGFHVPSTTSASPGKSPAAAASTHKAIEAYPFLLDAPHPKKIVRTAELISSHGHRATLEMSKPIVIYAAKF